MGQTSKRYVVHPGDTLEHIAATQLGAASAWPSIAKLNGLTANSQLLIGQSLSLPESAQQQRVDPRSDSITVYAHGGMPMEKRPATLLPGFAYHFVIADEMNPLTKRAVRKVLLPPRGVTDLKELERLSHPERFGFQARAPASPVSVGRHVGGRVDSRFTSVSTRPLGSPRFPGQRFWINLDKAQNAGVVVHDGAAIAADLDRVIAKTRNAQQRAKLTAIKELSSKVDHEVLLEGHVPAAAVKTGGMMAMTRGAQVMSGVGIVLTAYDLEQAGERSHRQHSIRPLAAESVRQAGGWAGAWAGAEVMGAAGAAVGIETGPGAIVTGLVGGVIGGIAGFTGASWLARFVEH